ncbi:MAG: TolC family protein [Candidatus Riflebacteria bacterium]|nr:TolC family protein [Candidatus Riflebacteria bacterium]
MKTFTNMKLLIFGLLGFLLILLESQAQVPLVPASTTVVLLLDQAIELALTHHPQITEAKARERQAKAATRDVRSRKDWQVKLEGEQVHLSKVPTLSGFPPAFHMSAVTLAKEDAHSGSITAQRVISSGNKIENGLRQSQLVAEASVFGTIRSRQLVAFAAERDFLQLVLAQGEVGVASQALDTAEEYLRVARNRYEAKSAAEFDVLRAEVQVEEARLDLVRANTTVETARASLGQTLAIPVEAWRASEEGLLASWTRFSVNDAIEMAFKQRPELAGAELNIQAAQSGLAVAHGERRPSVNFVADYQRNDPETTLQLNRWSAVVVADFPLIDGGHARASVDSAKAIVSQQKAVSDGIIKQIEREVRQAHARIDSAVTQVGVATKRLALAEEMLRVAHVRYSSGISTMTEVADAQTSVTRAKQGQIRAMSDLRIAEIELRLAMGVNPKETNR